MEARTGRIIVRKTLPYSVDVTSTPLLTDKEIIFGTAKEGLVALDNQTLEEKWKCPVILASAARPQRLLRREFCHCHLHVLHRPRHRSSGWVDALAYGPVAQLGWHAVEASVDSEGKVQGTCVGTGMGFDPAFYMYRPVSCAAAHGYGPVIWAGAEMIRLIKLQHPKMNDSAVQFYPQGEDK